MEERLRKFASLVEAGSYTKAAQRLHVSQPALSTAMRKLERELRTDLIVHGQSPLQLTPAGELAYDTARTLGQQTGLLKSRLADLAQEKPSIAIGMIDSVAGGIFARRTVLQELEEQARVLVLVNNSHYLLQAVTDKQLDVAFVVHQPAALPSTLVSRPLGSEPLVLVCHTAQLPDMESAVQRGELPQFIGYDQNSTTYGVVQQRLQDHGITPTPTFYATNPEVMLQLVLLKKGAGVFPLQLVRKQLRSNKLSLIHVDGKPLVFARPIDVAYRQGSRIIAPLPDVIDHIERGLSVLSAEAAQLK